MSASNNAVEGIESGVLFYSLVIKKRFWLQLRAVANKTYLVGQCSLIIKYFEGCFPWFSSKPPFVRTWVKIHIFEEKFQKANVCFYGRRVAIKSESLLESSALRPPWFFCRRPCSSPAARTPWLPSPAPQSAQASWDWYPSNYVQAVFYLVAMMRKLKEFYLCTSTLARDCCVIALNYKLYKAEQPFWNEWVLPNSCASVGRIGGSCGGKAAPPSTPRTPLLTAPTGWADIDQNLNNEESRPCLPAGGKKLWRNPVEHLWK